MRKIIYYVAISLDGYISGPNEDISDFVGQGNGLAQYLQDLQDFKTVIMGRKTYEFGYQFGLTPGQPAYPHMEHYIFSSSLRFEETHPQIHLVAPLDLEKIKELKQTASTDIYLCGGGEFAGWLLEQGQIDQLKIKWNPIILGGGIRLFGSSTAKAQWTLVDSQQYDEGLQIATFDRK